MLLRATGSPAASRTISSTSRQPSFGSSRTARSTWIQASNISSRLVLWYSSQRRGRSSDTPVSYRPTATTALLRTGLVGGPGQYLNRSAKFESVLGLIRAYTPMVTVIVDAARLVGGRPLVDARRR